MKFGICAGPDCAKQLAEISVDYYENTVVGINGMSDEEYADYLNQLSDLGIKCEAMNVLFPGDIPLMGENRDPLTIKEYISKAFARVSRLSPEVIVFGSGKARSCPQDFPMDKAWEQLVEDCHIIADEAEKYGITIAIEPLNTTETNMINTLMDGLKLVKAVNRTSVKLLADFYHMRMNDENMDSILECKGELVHTHIAAKEGRLCPAKADEDEYDAFFAALKAIGYNNRVSVEGRIDDMATQGPVALDLLKSFI